jgi:hypothetical protein
MSKWTTPYMKAMYILGALGLMGRAYLFIVR